MSTIVTRGTASAQALGYASASSATVPTYVEDVFSTYLFTGTGATQTITNGIDLSTEGGLVWTKTRAAVADHYLFDTDRGPLNEINSNTTGAQASLANSLTAFNTTGFDVGSVLPAGVTYVSWTFRKQPKFFDIVTYTGTGVARTIAHNLESAPGCIMVKRTDTTGDWRVYHRSLTSATYSLKLNTEDLEGLNNVVWNGTAPTSSAFSVGSIGDVNASGGTYVAYLFAHDAGGFGSSGTDNIISCGSYTGNGSTVGPVVTLGWEPQWLLVKRITGTIDSWFLIDSTREFSAGLIASATHNLRLEPNITNGETQKGSIIPRSNGFQLYGADGNDAQTNAASAIYAYIAIRRGPMRVPTSGSRVLELVTRLGTGANALVPATNLTDFAFIKNRGYAPSSQTIASRITKNGYMLSTSTAVEGTSATYFATPAWDVMGGVKVGANAVDTNYGTTAGSYINYLMSRAPQFSDVLSYIFPATLVADTRIPHNLTIPPELIIAKTRVSALGWYVYHKDMGIGPYVRLNAANTLLTPAGGTWGASNPTATDFGVNPANIVAASATAIFYLFATCPGVSKVGSYVGTTATAKQIDCGFTTGARFVLIKRINGAAGDWYLWDSARGITTGNDPYFLANTTAAEVTSTNYLNTYGAGFELTSSAPAALNTTGSTFIFLAIA